MRLRSPSALVHRSWLPRRSCGWPAHCFARDGRDDAKEALALARDVKKSAEALVMPALAAHAKLLVDQGGMRRVDDQATGLPPVSRRDRGRARLTAGARTLVGWLSRDHDDDELTRRFGSALAQRALFAAMAKSFQPTAAFGFQGEILFEVRLPTDGPDPLPPDWWTIEVRGHKAISRQERASSPAVVVQTELPDLIHLLSGELHPMRAVIEGRVHIDGDVLVAGRIPEMFGGFDAPDAVAKRQERQHPSAERASRQDSTPEGVILPIRPR
jgi:hypothetical protein